MGTFDKQLKEENILLKELDKSRGRVLVNKSNEEKILKNILYSGRLTSPKYLASSTKPQAVFNIMSKGAGFRGLNIMAKYIARDLSYQDDKDSLNLFDENGETINSYQEVVDQWSKEFLSQDLTENQQWKLEKKEDLENKRNELVYYSESRKLTEDEINELESLKQQIAGNFYIDTNKAKRSLKVNAGTDYYHLVFSAGGKHNHKKQQTAMEEVIRTQFATKGLKTMSTLHTDTENDHFHVILNAKCDFTQKTVYFDKEDLFAIRQNFTKELERVGINRGAILRKDNPILLSKVLKQSEGLTKSMSIYEAKKQKGNINVVKFKQDNLKKLDFLLTATSGGLKLEKDLRVPRKELKNNKKLLNQYKVDLLKATDVTEVQATINNLEKVDTNFTTKFNQLDTLQLNGNTAINTAKSKRQLQLKEQLKTHQDDILEAIKYFKSIKNNSNKDTIEIALERLKTLQKAREPKKQSIFRRR